MSRMRAVGSDGPPASKVRAIRGLLVFPISISVDDTSCTPGGVKQDDCVGWGVGVVPCVGSGVGITVVPGDGVEIPVGPGISVCIALGPGVAVGRMGIVGVPPLVFDVPPHPARIKSARILTIPRPTKCVKCRCFLSLPYLHIYASLLNTFESLSKNQCSIWQSQDTHILQKSPLKQITGGKHYSCTKKLPHAPFYTLSK